MAKVGKQLLGWDTCDVIKAKAECLKESGDYKGKTDDELFQMACEDQDIQTFAWRDLCDCLTGFMKRNTHGGWKAEVNNFGWRSLNGEKMFHATNGRELLHAILPKTDCSFKVYRYGNGFAVNNAHHDSPTWQREWYYVTPCKNQN